MSWFNEILCSHENLPQIFRALHHPNIHHTKARPHQEPVPFLRKNGIISVAWCCAYFTSTIGTHVACYFISDKTIWISCDRKLTFLWFSSWFSIRWAAHCQQCVIYGLLSGCAENALLLNCRCIVFCLARERHKFHLHNYETNFAGNYHHTQRYTVIPSVSYHKSRLWWETFLTATT